MDKNDYYGGAEAAFTLKEAEDWADRVNNGETLPNVCSYADE